MKAVIDGQLLRIKDYQSACEQKQEIINGLQEQVTNQQIIIDDWIK